MGNSWKLVDCCRVSSQAGALVLDSHNWRRNGELGMLSFALPGVEQSLVVALASRFRMRARTWLFVGVLYVLVDSQAQSGKRKKTGVIPQGNRILIGLFSPQNSLQDIVTPPCLESLASNRAFFHRSVPLENRECQPPKGTSDFWRVAAADSAFVLSEGDVKRPVQ